MLTSGQILENRYRIAKILSQKEDETTYRAWDITLNRPCSVTEFTDLSPSAAQNFQHQANQISALNHPNLPKLVDFISLPGQGNYLVMEFFDGTSLQNELEKSGRPLAVNEVINWGMQVCEALQVLHSQNPPLVHGSISPASLLISPDRQNLMLDFQGTQVPLSASTRKFEEPVSASKQTIPLDEQPVNPVPDIRSDIFDLGVTLYRLVTGQAPPDINSSRSETPITDLRSINPAISQDFARIILHCMAINPDERFSSAVEVHEALQKLSGNPSTFSAGEFAQTTLPVHPAVTQPQYQGNIPYGSPPPTQRAYDVLPPAGYKPKKNSCLLWGAIIAGVLVLLGIAAAVVLVIAAPSLLPFLSERGIVNTVEDTPEPEESLEPTRIPETATPEAGFRVMPAYDGTPDPKFGFSSLGDICSHASDPVLVPKLYTYTCTAPMDKPIVISMGWCTTTQDILDQNWSLMQYDLNVDGITFDVDQDTAFISYTNSQGYCYAYKAYVEGLTPGEHDITYSFTMSEPLNDGFDDYQAGAYVLQHLITIP